MRQKIIEQRKQRIKNATQRFQRSHLPPPPPPPQKYMQCEPCICMKLSLLLKKRGFNLSTEWDFSDVLVERINVPTVEEALIEIQSNSDSDFQSSTSTSNYRKSRYELNKLDLYKCLLITNKMWYFTVFTQCLFFSLNYIFSPILRTHSSSPSPIKPSQSSHHDALTAVEAISQLLPAKLKTGIINHQEPEEQQHQQQDYSPQVYGFAQN